MTDNPKKYVFTLPVGTILTGGQNSYHIEDVLGQGGYGITYKVWTIIKNGQIPVKVPFAIKEHFVNGRCHRAADGVTVEYSQEAAEDVEESLKDFVKEGRLLNKICQVSDEAVRYIVPVNEVIEVNNTAYFVMQYLEGGSLRRMVLNGGALPEEKALALIKPIVRAVDFIHRHKVLHMDIKPENIVMHRNLLTGQEEPVLIDFGVSLHFNKKGGLTSKHTSFGHTEGFSPIEQYGAVESFAPWIDVYALGATLYYLLAGKTPPKAFDMSLDDVDKNLPPEVSKRTKAAIKHAMTKDYHDRTQSASTFLWELENDYEPVDTITSKEQKNVADTNVTVKKKVAHTGDITPPTLVPPTPKRKWFWLLAACVVLVALFVVFKAIPNGTTDADQPIPNDTTAANKQDTVHHGKEEGIEDTLTPVVKDQVDTKASVNPSEKEVKSDGNSGQSQNGSKAEKKSETTESKRENIPVDNESRYQEAVSTNNKTVIKELAAKGYAKAYSKVANIYLKEGRYSDADNYARRALGSNYGKKEAINVIEILDGYGYYDNGEHGGKPKY